jgi:hypothetical protein
MQVRYVEDLASHDDPESCVGGREAVGEALTGEHAGGVCHNAPWFMRVG